MVLSGFTFHRALLRALFASIALSCSSSQAAEGVEVAGTLPEDYLPELKTILANAFNRSPEMVAREFERVIQDARLTMAKSARLPGLGGNFDYGLTQTATASNTSSQSRNTGAQYSFNLRQSLFHWGAIKNEIEISKIGVHLTSKDTARIYRSISLTLRKAYLALIVQKARLRHAREGLQLIKADVAIAKTRKADGTIPGAVLAGEELRLREAELLVGRSTAEFESSRRSFARVAGLEELSEDAIPAEIPEPKYEEDLITALSAKTLRENARSTLEWEVFDLKLRQAQLRQKVVNTRLLPKFGVGATYSLSNNTYVNGPTVNQQAVTEQRFAVSGSWNIFDGFATGGAKREAAASRRALEYRKTSEIEELLQTVQQLERTLKFDAEQLELADLRLGIARGAEELVAEGVKLGTTAKGNLERGRVNTMQAYATSLEARAVFLGRWAELVSTAGEDPVLKNLSDRNAPKK
jgi:outer membrane protein TolC